MRSDRWALVLMFVLVVLSGAGLLRVSQMVQNAENHAGRLDSDMAREQETIRVLNAEWSYLNRPDHLEQMAADYLGLAPEGKSSALKDRMIDVSTDLPPSVLDDYDPLLRTISTESNVSAGSGDGR